MADAPVLETERLLLRPWRTDDFERYFQLMGDADAARYIGGGTPRAVVWRRFLQMPGAWSLQGFGMFALEEKASGRWVGQAGPWQPDGWPGTEVGYALHPDSWGKGYATEASARAIDWAFDTLGWDEVIQCIDAGNAASKAVSARLGARFRQRLDAVPPFDGAVEIWGQTRDQWRARSRPS